MTMASRLMAFMLIKYHIQSNLISLNTGGSFTRNCFYPYEILSVAQENKYSGNYFVMKLYVVCTH